MSDTSDTDESEAPDDEAEGDDDGGGGDEVVAPDAAADGGEVIAPDAAEDGGEVIAPDAADAAEDGEDEEGGAASRILNQEEIDSLLGFDAGAGDEHERSGIAAIVSGALVQYERLPMLEVVFDRLVRLMTTSLRNFTSDNVEVSLDNITSIRFGDYLNSIPLPGHCHVVCRLAVCPAVR